MTVAEDSCRLRRFGLTERLLLKVLGLKYLRKTMYSSTEDVLSHSTSETLR